MSLFLNNHPEYQRSQNQKIIELRNNQWLNISTDDNPAFTLQRDLFGGSTIINNDKKSFSFEQERHAEFKSKIYKEFGDELGNRLMNFYHQDIAGMEKNIMKCSLGSRVIIEKNKRIIRQQEIVTKYVNHIIFNKEKQTIHIIVCLKDIKILNLNFYKEEEILLPGSKISTYLLTEKGFRREEVEYSNPILEDLDLGNKNILITSKEQTFAMHIEALHHIINKENYPDIIKQQILSLINEIKISRKRNPENLSDLNECLEKTHTLLCKPTEETFKQYADTIDKFKKKPSLEPIIDGIMLAIASTLLFIICAVTIASNITIVIPFITIGAILGLITLTGSSLMFFKSMQPKETALSNHMRQISQVVQSNLNPGML